MKRIILIFLITLSGTLISVNAQTVKVNINNDSLFIRFQRNSPFEVLEWIKSVKPIIDYESIYNDVRLKSLVFKWLDEHEYYLYEFERFKESINKRIYLDDSARAQSLKMFILSRPNEKIAPPEYVYFFLAQVKYPESYLILKKRWENEQKCVDCNSFFYILFFDDPDAVAKFDSMVSREVMSKDQTNDKLKALSPYILVDNISNISNLEKLLTIENKDISIPEADSKKYKCQILEILLSRIVNQYEINVDTHVLESSCNDKLKLYLPQIITASQKLKEKYEENNRYWKKNIPYYISK